MKQKLIKSAKEKGFETNYIDLDSFKTNETDITEYMSSLIETVYYLWMCELQKWLRDKHNIHMSLVFELEDGHNEFYVDTWTVDRKNMDCQFSGLESTYEKALEKGLFKALKLIK